jgi:hypothetical protein
MLIHNFYQDILLSIRTLFDSVIFKDRNFISTERIDTFIKSYQFNLANRTFAFSKKHFKTNFEFPSVIVTLNEDRITFGHEKPNVIQRIDTQNINSILVLSDPENRVDIYLQEEHVLISLDIQINCESQLQAKEIEFTIRRFLPLDKYIQIMSFTSFIDIEPDFLLSLDMDFNSHEIINLFVRLNKNFGSPMYSFSILYRPLIKLASSNVTINDGNSSSFPVNLSIEYAIQMPMWLTTNIDRKIIEKINIDFHRFGNEPISDNNCRQLLSASSLIKKNNYLGDELIVRSTDGNNIKSSKSIQNSSSQDFLTTTAPTDTRIDCSIKQDYLTIRNLIIYNIKDYEFIEENYIDNGNYILGIRFKENDFKIYNEYRFNIMDINGKIHYDVKPYSIAEDINQVKFAIPKKLFNSMFNPTINKPLIIQFLRPIDL